jgi:hypothetical protein
MSHTIRGPVSEHRDTQTGTLFTIHNYHLILGFSEAENRMADTLRAAYMTGLNVVVESDGIKVTSIEFLGRGRNAQPIA